MENNISLTTTQKQIFMIYDGFVEIILFQLDKRHIKKVCFYIYKNYGIVYLRDRNNVRIYVPAKRKKNYEQNRRRYQSTNNVSAF